MSGKEIKASTVMATVIIGTIILCGAMIGGSFVLGEKIAKEKRVIVRAKSLRGECVCHIPRTYCECHKVHTGGHVKDQIGIL